MGVYIKGMEMPKSCFCCPMREWHIVHGEKITSCRAAVMLIKDEDDKPDWCPIFEVPPHGRLIDADIMIKKYEPDINRRIYGGNFIFDLEHAPTVIPADKDGET